MYNRYNFIFILKYYYYPIEPNILRALNNACFLRTCCAAVIDPVFSKVREAASIAVVHFLPVFVFLLLLLFLPPRIFLVLFILIFIRLVDIYIYLKH